MYSKITPNIINILRKRNLQGLNKDYDNTVSGEITLEKRNDDCGKIYFLSNDSNFNGSDPLHLETKKRYRYSWYLATIYKNNICDTDDLFENFLVNLKSNIAINKIKIQ